MNILRGTTFFAYFSVQVFAKALIDNFSIEGAVNGFLLCFLVDTEATITTLHGNGFIRKVMQRDGSTMTLKIRF